MNEYGQSCLKAFSISEKGNISPPNPRNHLTRPQALGFSLPRAEKHKPAALPSCGDSGKLSLVDFCDFKDFKFDDATLGLLLDAYPERFRTTLLNLWSCGLHDVVYRCPDCGRTVKKPSYCHSGFCSNEDCMESRYRLVLNRLRLKGVDSKRLYHFVVGSNAMSLKQLRAAFRRLVSGLRAKGFKIQHINVPDLTMDQWLHLHVALLPEPNGKLNQVREFVRACNNIVGRMRLPFVFHNIGWRSKKGIFDYFAKRAAGMLGHLAKGYYGFQDCMTLTKFFSSIYRTKRLASHLPAPKSGLACIVGTLSYFECPDCGAKLEFLGRSDMAVVEDALNEGDVG